MTPVTTQPLWSPTPETVDRSTLRHYMTWLAATRGLRFDDYPALWRWSVTDPAAFWASVWEYAGLDAVSGYDEVLASDAMPGAAWFTGARLNFAERCLSSAADDAVALVAVDEQGGERLVTYADLRRDVAALAATLREVGVEPGDCVAGFLPNVPEAVVAMLASAAAGAVWTVASPESGAAGTLSRLGQARPKVLVTALDYRYGGKDLDRREVVAEICAGLPGLECVVTLGGGDGSTGDDADPWADFGAGFADDAADQASEPVAAAPADPDLPPGVLHITWAEAMYRRVGLTFADTAFDDPLWVLWSSGTTGSPKGIVQGHGGITVELFKALALQCDVGRADRLFVVTSTGWMIWNLMIGALLLGGTAVLYDGSPGHPDADAVWRVAERTGATALCAGAAVLMNGYKSGSVPRETVDLSALRSIIQTGSTLPVAAWHWLAEDVRPGVWVQSISGGTDVCSALCGANPLQPVEAGRIVGPWLGVDLQSWDAGGDPVFDTEGELVVLKPLPSMPLRFLGDPDGQRYRDSYFSVYPGVWHHGDAVVMAPDLSLAISGRSDATLNRQGVRIGSAEIYSVVEALPEVADSMVVGVDLPDGAYAMPLFVVPAAGVEVDDDLRSRIREALRRDLSPRHVPDDIVPVDVVPRTLTGKKLEVPVKKILQGTPVERVSSSGAVTHPEMLEWFARYGRSLRSSQ